MVMGNVQYISTGAYAVVKWDQDISLGSLCSTDPLLFVCMGGQPATEFSKSVAHICAVVVNAQSRRHCSIIN